MEIIINPAKEIVVVQERKKTISKVTIIEITDNSNQKSVIAFTKEVGRITLWKDAEYDSIGQWTDADVEARIKEIYS
jgi:hypothetical protein